MNMSEGHPQAPDGQELTPEFKKGLLSEVREAIRLMTEGTVVAEDIQALLHMEKKSPEILKSQICEILGDLDFDIMYPNGNSTCLIPMSGTELESRREECLEKATVLVQRSLVEQVGFYSVQSGTDQQKESKTPDIILEMSGGEFCLNATISAAALVYKNTSPTPNQDLKIQCSGNPNLVVCECKFDQFNVVHVDAVFSADPEFEEMSEGTLVRLPGISHLMQEVDPKQDPDNDGVSDLQAFIASHQESLADDLAVGLIRYRLDLRGAVIWPTVYVKKTGTTTKETACGSGTAALIFLIQRNRELSGNDRPCIYAVAQPSDQWLTGKFKNMGEFPRPAVIIQTEVFSVCGSKK